jgi:hypothetical protein
MNIQTIEQSCWPEDAIDMAHEAERIAYINNDLELAKAYAMIAELLAYKLSIGENEEW